MKHPEDKPRQTLSRQLLGTASAFTLSNLCEKLFPFLVLPLLSYKLAPEAFAFVTLYTATLGLTNYIVGLSLEGSLSVDYFKMDAKSYRQAMGSVLILSFIQFILVSLGLLILSEQLSLTSGLPSIWLSAAAFHSLFWALQQILLVTYRSQSRARAFFQFNVSKAIFEQALVLLFVFGLDWSWEGRLGATLIAQTIYAAIALFLIWKDFGLELKLEKSGVQHLLMFGLPLAPHAIGTWCLAAGDRYIVNHLLTKTETGQYGLAFTLAAALGLVTQSFNQAWAPYLYSRLKSPHRTTLLRICRLSIVSAIALAIISVTFSLSLQFVLHQFFDARYHQAITLIPGLVLAFFFDGLYLMVTNYIFHSRKTYLVSLGTILAGILKLGLALALIPHMGLLGAVIATILGYFTLWICSALISRRIYSLPWQLAWASFLRKPGNAWKIP